MTDRPDFTESTKTVPRGRFQFETGYTFTSDREGDRRTRDHTFPEALLRAGIAENWELRFAWSGLSLTDEVFRAENDAGRRTTFHTHDDGGTDMTVGFKVQLAKQAEWLPEMGLIGEVSLPTGAGGKTSDDVDPGFKFLWSYELTERLSLGGNLNLANVSDSNGRLFQSGASLSLGYALTDWMGSYVECFGIYPNARDSDGAHYLNGGLTFPISDDFQIDVRIGHGLNGEADGIFTGVGFGFRF